MSTYSEDVLATSGLLSYFKLGESSGNFQDSKGSVESTSVETGIERAVTSLVTNETKDKALKFKGEGSGRRVRFGNNFQFGGTSSFTFEFWFKPETVEGIADIVNYSVGKNGEEFESGYAIYRSGTDLRVIRKSTFKTDASGVFSSGTTYHVGITYDGSNIRTYINGVEKGSPKASSGSISLSGEFGLGDSELGAAGSCKQVLDQLAVYNTALSEATLKAHYEKGIEEEKSGETITGKATLTGTGTLTGKGTRVYKGAGSTTGTGSLTGAGKVVRIGKGTVTGTGSLTGAGTVEGTVTGAGSITGTGSLTGAGKFFRVGKGTVTGTGSLAGSGLHIAIGKGEITGTGSMNATAPREDYSTRVEAANDIQSFWKLDEASGTFQDAIGSINSTSVSGVTYGETGIIGDEGGKQIKLTATTSEVNFGANYRFKGKEPFSVEGWVTPEPGEDNLNQKGIFATSAYLGGGWFIGFQGSEGNLFVTRGKTIIMSSSGGFTVEKPLTPNKTHHLVMTYDGETVRVYVDSVLVGSKATAVEVENTGSFRIGTGGKGKYDDVAIYNVAISPALIEDHYEYGAGKWRGAGSITGTSSLTGKGAFILKGSGSILGEGLLTGEGSGEPVGKGSLEGIGTLEATGLLIALGQGEVTGTSELTGSSKLIAFGKGSITGVGTLVGEGVLRTYQSNPPTLLVLKPNASSLVFRATNTKLPLDPNKTEMSIDPNKTTLALDD